MEFRRVHFRSPAQHNNDVLALYAFDHGTAMCQAVAVGSHGAYKARLEHEQHTDQVITNILLRHGKVHHVEQMLQRFLGQRKGHVPLLGIERKSTRMNSSHSCASRMPSTAFKKKKTT